MTGSRLAMSVALFGVVVSVGAPPNLAPAHGAPPHGPDAVVLRVTTIAPPGVPGGPTVTIRRDGWAVIQPTLAGRGHPSPEPLVFQIDKAGEERVLRAIADAGLLRRTEYGDARVTDHRVTIIEVNAVGHHRVVRVDALGLGAAGQGLPAGVRSARAALRTFAIRVTRPTFYDGARR
jgi:hypothetical protein